MGAEQKVAVTRGASQGIGTELVRAFLERGDPVVRSRAAAARRRSRSALILPES